MIKKIFKKFSLVILIVLVLMLAGTSYYFYKKSTLQSVDNATQNSQAEIAKLVEQVGKLIILPEGETPTIATVTDPSVLKDQDFFSKAEMGDKVLIYTNAKKVVLYRPSIDKIVEVAPLNIKANDATPTPAATSTQKTTTVKSVKK